MATKRVKLACYEILPNEPKLTKSFDILKDLSEAFSIGNITNRSRLLSDISVEGEQEFITKQKKSGTGLFCTFLHLKSGGAIIIQKSFMDKNEFSLEELAANDEESIAGHIKDYTYFFLTKKLLILRSTRGIPSSHIEIYLNWFLKKSLVRYSAKNAVFTLKPCLKKSFDPRTIGSIELGKNVIIGEKSVTDTVVRPVVKGLEQFLKAGGFDDIDAATVVDASVILKILKPEKKDEKRSQKALQSILKAVKSDETVLKDRRGNKIIINNVKEFKEVNVPHLSTGFPDVAVLEQSMVEYCDEVSPKQ